MVSRTVVRVVLSQGGPGIEFPHPVRLRSGSTRLSCDQRRVQRNFDQSPASTAQATEPNPYPRAKLRESGTHPPTLGDEAVVAFAACPETTGIGRKLGVCEVVPSQVPPVRLRGWLDPFDKLGGVYTQKAGPRRPAQPRLARTASRPCPRNQRLVSCGNSPGYKR